MRSSEGRVTASLSGVERERDLSSPKPSSLRVWAILEENLTWKDDALVEAMV